MWAKSVLLSNWISRRVTRGGRGGGLPRLFSKIRKKCPNFRKKCRDCVHLGLNFFILNVVLRVSRRKKTHIFSLRGFSFMCCRCLSTCPDSEKTPLPWKIPGYAPDISSTHGESRFEAMDYFNLYVWDTNAVT